jgi:hypothetical protein
LLKFVALILFVNLHRAFELRGAGLLSEFDKYLLKESEVPCRIAVKSMDLERRIFSLSLGCFGRCPRAISSSLILEISVSSDTV